MLLNVDRKRIYILSGVGVFLILMLGLYHAPAYVPTEVSRMKTSVSTWLKGTEPSLDDEMYKDSPHFSSGSTQTVEEEEEQVIEEPHIQASDLFETGRAHDDEAAFHILPIETDDKPDLLPPVDAGHSTASTAPSHTLAVANDFIGVLPPINVLTVAASASDSTHAASISHATDSATHHSSHPHLEQMSKPEDAEATTLSTHIISATSIVTPTHVAIPTNVREALEDEKWFLDEDGKR